MGIKSTYKLLTIYLDRVVIPYAMTVEIDLFDDCLVPTLDEDVWLFDCINRVRKVKVSELFSFPDYESVCNQIGKRMKQGRLILIVDCLTGYPILDKLMAKRIVQLQAKLKSSFPRVDISLKVEEIKVDLLSRLISCCGCVVSTEYKGLVI